MKLQWIKKILSDYANKQNSVRGLGEKKKERERKSLWKNSTREKIAS